MPTNRELTPKTGSDLRAMSIDLARWAKFYADLAEEMENSGIPTLSIKGWTTLEMATSRIPGSIRSAETAMRAARQSNAKRKLPKIPGVKTTTMAEQAESDARAAADAAEVVSPTRTPTGRKPAKKQAKRQDQEKDTQPKRKLG